MTNIEPRPIVISHTGPLTTASLDNSLPGPLFRPASNPKVKKRVNPDPYHLGWEFGPSDYSYHFKINDLPFATAEGVVTLAAFLECLRSQSNSQVKLEISEKASAWSDALQLGQLIRGRWLRVNKFPSRFARPAGCYSFPFWRQPILDRESCQVIAEQLSNQVELILKDIRHFAVDEVGFATKLVFTEALLNVFEHAYSEGDEKVALGAITVTPIPRPDQLRKHAYVTNEEAEWFSKFGETGLMLEIAVADYGRNIPYTLWKAYKKEFPNELSEGGLRLGSHSGRLRRADLHHRIALWAFNHRSTRKTREEFPNELAFLNWRGLHRAINTAARLSGCMVVRSGQARAGYAFYEDLSKPLTSLTKGQHEFPGTGITLRIPIPKSRRRLIVNIPATPDEISPPIKFEGLIKSSEIGESMSLHSAGRATFYGLVHPFQTMGSDDVVTLLRNSLTISPHIVPIHFFLNIEPPSALDQLSSFEDGLLGPPRLVAFWKPDRHLSWKFIGVMPRTVRQMIHALEETGTATIPSDSASRVFIEGLSRAYSPHIQLADGTISLSVFKSHIPSEAVDEALQNAFDLWSHRTKRAWRFDEPGQFIRLRTGRLLTEYVSVYKLLDSDDFLSSEVGRRFALILRKFQRDFLRLCVITDSEASYFIARMLLRDQGVVPDIYVDPPRAVVAGRPVIIFIDAIHKGDTLKHLIEKTRDCRGVVCCVDLRLSGPSKVEVKPSITSLLEYPFDPKEVTDGALSESDIVLEVDAVTHIPEESAPAEALSIGITSQREHFIMSNPQLFRYGLQRGAGRIHVVRLPVEGIIEDHREELLAWLEGAVAFAKNQTPSIRDIVIFTRNEAAIKEIVPEVATRLRKSSESAAAVYSAVLPYVPSGSQEIFSRPTPELFYNLEHIEGRRQLFVEPPSDFLALYLDDACVTGKSLLNFLNRTAMASIDQLPMAILALPILSRFSPAEEIFFRTVCRGLTAHNKPETALPFLFQPLFRLQVRSFDLPESTAAFRLLTKLNSSRALLDERLLRYLHGVENNIRSILADPHGHDLPKTVNSHPFYTGTQYEEAGVSARVVQIRHLMALQAQNLGVLSSLLHELLEALNQRDYSLLTMLATEPSLVEVPPLNKGVRHDITRLAMGAILSDQSSAIKSDALCILALQGQVLVDRLAEILQSIGDVPELVDQLLVFIFSRKDESSLWYGGVGNAVRESSSGLSTETYNYVQSWLQSFDEMTEQRPVLTEHAAHQAIANLIAQTSYHGNGLDKLNALSDWVFSRQSERAARDGLVVRGLIQDVDAFFRETVLPGIDGLGWWAEFRAQNPRAAAALNLCFRQLIPPLNRLAAKAESLTSQPVGEATANHVEEVWTVIRSHSLTSQADTFLSRLPEMPADEIPIVERWLPEFFCFPVEIVSGLGSYYLLNLEVTAKWELPGQRKIVVAIPFPLDPVRRVFSLLLQDMRSHGRRTANRVQLSVRHKDESNELQVVFENRVNRRDTPRTGMSQDLARSIAKRWRFEIDADPPGKPGDLYRVKVTFSDPFYLRWS